jgi:hypothetical protein
MLATQFLIGVFRNGASVPKYLFDNPKNPDSYQSNYLLDTGIRQNFFLGELLKKDYSELFSDTFKYQNVNITSSNYNSTLASSTSLFSGLFNTTLPYKLETPEDSHNYLPRWEEEFMRENLDDDNDYTLPYSMTLSAPSSSESGFDFYFRSNYSCSFIQDSINDNISKYNISNFKIFENAYKLFKENGFDLKNYKLEENFESLALLSIYLEYLINKDPRHYSEKITYQMQAHMIFINSMYYYSQFDNNQNVDYFLSYLASDWDEILGTFNKTIFMDSYIHKYFSPVQFYMGFALNIASLIQRFHKPNAMDQISSDYFSHFITSKIDNIKNENDFIDFLNYLDTNFNYINLGFTSNLLFEVNSDQSSNQIIISIIL